MRRVKYPSCWLRVGLACLVTVLLTQLFLLRDPSPEGEKRLGVSGVWTDTWQTVSKDPKFFVFSAYFDDRMSPSIVRVVATTITRHPPEVKCLLWVDHTPVATVPAKKRIIRENWGLKYSAFFVLCPVDSSRPTMVSLLAGNQQNATNILPVHYASGPPTENLAICVKPVHNYYNLTLNLLEFLEFNSILGSQHFIIYNHTMAPEVSEILEQYSKEGLATILPWDLDLKSQKEIRTEGLFAALNDCLYRAMHKFLYVMMVDLDEFILPNKHASYLELLKFLIKIFPSNKTGAFSFQNAFFYHQWDDDPLASKIPYPLMTLRKTLRKSTFHPHGKRSKLIVMPERVIEVGNHQVWEFIPDFKPLKVPPSLAFLHHYRTCEFGGDQCINTNRTRDRRAYFWRRPLVERIRQKLIPR